MAFNPFRSPDPSSPIGRLSAPARVPAARRSFLLAAGLVVVALVLGAAAARADTVGADVASTGNQTIYLGSSTVWNYQINAFSGGGDPDGCNASDGTPAIVTINVPAAVTVSPPTLTFSECGVLQPVTLSSNTLGHFLVFPSVVDAGGGIYNGGPGTLFLDVVSPPNNPPTVSVTGVIEGGSYEAGFVPVAGCLVEDVEDGTLTFAATLGQITGDLTVLGLGSQTASCAYEDSGGLSAGAVVTYSIVDTQAPIFGPLTDLIVEATGPDGTIVTFDVTATDSVDPAPEVNCAPPSGAAFPIGTTPVTCTATDAVGNSGVGGFNVTVVDTTPPRFDDFHADFVVEATGPEGATVDYGLPTATDLVDGSVEVVCAPGAGLNFPLGQTIVTCSVSDAIGNESTLNITVSVVDTTAPLLDLPSDFTVQTDDPTGTVVSFAATATDLVDGDVPVSCDPESGAHFPVGVSTVDCEAADAAGNQVGGSFLVTVEYVPTDDTTPPTIVCDEPDGQWHATDVTISCRATDDGRGIAPNGETTATVVLSTAVPVGVETADAKTGSAQVCDVAGNCATAGPIGGNKVDKAGPTRLRLQPDIPHGGVYLLLRFTPNGPIFGSPPQAPTCTASDGGSGLASCQVMGFSARPGIHLLTIIATDAVGNVTVQYRLYAIVLVTFYW